MIERTDIAIIGGGLAACAAAIEAAKYGLHVTLLDKGRLGRSGSSCTAGAGFSFASPQYEGDPLDAAKARHAADTIAAGLNLNDPRLVEAFVDDAPRQILELEYLGIRLPRNSRGRLATIRAPAHGEPRTISTLGGGPVLMDTLRREVLHRRVRVLERVMAIRILSSEGRVAGLYALETRGEGAHRIAARAVILAAGSATQLYPYASANYRTTGDAMALAATLGLPMANMEFNEFTLIPKVGKRIISTPAISGMMAAGSHLLNGAGERFMLRYDAERAEMTTRARLVQAVVSELSSGRGPVWNNSLSIPPERRTRLREDDWDVLHKLRSAGLNWPEEPFEWVPATHLCLGGLVIDPDGATELPGFYGAGEAVTGVHGANRLSGNALSECLVFGIRAGRAASLYAGQVQAVPLPADQIAAIETDLQEACREDGPSADEWKQAVRQAAWEGIGTTRSAKGIREAVQAFEQLRQERPRCESRRKLIAILEARNLIFTGQLIAQAALQREESRGQHVRQDHPGTLPEWRKWLVIRSTSRGFQVTIQDVGRAG